MRVAWRRRKQSEAPAQVPGAGDARARADGGESAVGPGDCAPPDARFRPGGTGWRETQAYTASLEAGQVGACGSEDPRLRSARLARRRHLLLVGGLPALLTLAAAAWLAAVTGMTMSANQAVVQQDYATAVARYSRVEAIDPWLERWRVLYNLGTAESLAGHDDAAVGHLEEALAVAPRAPTDAEGNLPGGSPECLVRTNLHAAYLVLSTLAADDATATRYEAQAQSAAATCPVTTPQTSSSPTASSGPTGASSPTASATPTGQPSGGPTGSPSPSPAPTAPSPSASPADPKEEKLRQRNEGANETQDSGGAVSGTRRW